MTVNTLMSMSVPRPGINLLTPEIQQNPYPTYALLRERFPVCCLEPDGHYALSRFEDVRFALTHAELFTAGCAAVMQPDWLREDCRRNMFILDMDPPEHTRYRSVVTRAFASRVMAGVLPLMRRAAEDLFSGIDVDHPVDFIESFSYPYVGTVYGKIIGMDSGCSLDDIRRWIEMVEVNTPQRPDDEHIRAVESAILEQNRYYDQLIQARRAQPKADLISELVHAKVDGEYLSDYDLRCALGLFVSAGFQTPSQLITNAIIHLSRRPDLWQLLAAAPEKIPAYVEELLRTFSPTQCLLRMTTQTVTLHGMTIPQGALVSIIIASANYDQHEFPHPETFDMDRPNIKNQLSFGYGAHICAGIMLARYKVRVALEVLLEKFSGIDCPADEQLEWVGTMTTRGVRSLPVRFRKK